MLTQAQDGEHLVVLAHLRRRRSLRGREGFGFLSPTCLASSVGFGAFVEVKRLFFTILGVKKRRRKEVTGVTERQIGRGWRVWSVQPADARGEVRGFVTGVSDHSWDRRVRSHTQESSAKGRFDRTRWRVRSHATGRVRSMKSLSGPLLDSNRTPGVTRPVML
jgi:hypothetical protein